MSLEHSTTDETGRIKSNRDDAFDAVCVASEQLQALIVEIRGIAREMEAGKVPRPKNVKRLAATLARWESSQFTPLVWKLIDLADSERKAGFNEGLFCIPINDEPFKSAFWAAGEWYREHPEDFPGDLTPPEGAIHATANQKSQ